MIGPSNPQTDPQTMNGGLIIMKELDHARSARRQIFRFTSRALSIGLLSFGVASCDFEVENISSVNETVLEDVAVVPLLLASAEAALQEGWSFQTLTAGLASDEYYWGATCTPIELIDVGIWDVTNIGRGGALNERWASIAKDQWITQNIHERITELQGAGHANLAWTGLYRGMMRIIQADMWAQITYDGGPPVTPLGCLSGNGSHSRPCAGRWRRQQRSLELHPRSQSPVKAHDVDRDGNDGCRDARRSRNGCRRGAGAGCGLQHADSIRDVEQ